MLLTLLSMLDAESDKLLLEKLYLRYSSAMKKEAMNIVGHKQSSEDLVQEAFVRIINNIEFVRDLMTSQQVSYLATTIINVSIDFFRKRKTDDKYMYYGQENDMADNIYDYTYNPIDVYMRNLSYEALGESMLKLDRKDRFLLESKYFEDMTEKEIAQKLGINEKNISTYLFRAKKRLANIMISSGLELNSNDWETA